MPITWDTQADAKLLAGIVATSSPAINYQAVADYIGDGCTISALKHRIQRIKERAGITGNPRSASGSGASKTSPVASKVKHTTTSKVTKTRKTKPRSAKISDDNADQKTGPENEEEHLHQEEETIQEEEGVIDGLERT
ncbi:hypothetical protein N7532_004676 [Penicillium argentinense]|uniref:Uncharacterized protein n=1 Tax=Penicillium argentinense TaxID=1131581 RepID=A0A9W9KGD5_9EURO|nr:uncharacterized protein N7532_004676 [Penicillium argentinense]KAJ5104147.1 hypothetical protein N7532_004676 [Penicillium argentinense]